MSTTPPSQTPPAKGGISAKAIVAIVLAVLALVFVFSNLGHGSLHFLGFAFTMPVWIWFLIVLIAGIAIGSLFPWLRPKKKR